MKMTVTAAQLVGFARERIKEIDPARLVEMQQAGAAVIDVREPDEFTEGRVPGANNIPRGVLEFKVDGHPAVNCSTDPALADRDQPLVVYCRTGGRSALAAGALGTMGFSNVYSLAGGFTAWTESGHPVEA